jgi:hypothetical protein
MNSLLTRKASQDFRICNGIFMDIFASDTIPRKEYPEAVIVDFATSYYSG